HVGGFLGLAEGAPDRVLERGEGTVIFVDRVDAIDFCLLEVATGGRDVEERRGANPVPLFREGQRFTRGLRVHVLQSRGLERGLKVQEGFRDIRVQLHFATLHRVARILTTYLRLLQSTFATQVVEDGQREEHAVRLRRLREVQLVAGE